MRSVGVEEEFLLVGRRSRQLAHKGDDVTEHAQDADPHGQFEHELKQPQAEIGSRPLHLPDELAADLRRLRRELAASAREEDATLIASGTSPVPSAARTTRDERYERMVCEFGAVARRELTCGMHIHVSVDSPAEGVAVIDRIAPWLHVLAALSANSPVHRGEETGYASYRTVLWGQWPTAGPTGAFGSLAAYRAQAAALVESGAAMDEGMLYFDARLSASYPTVEIRVCDVCPDVEDAVTIAALARALVETAARDDTPAPAWPVGVLRAAAWRAARYGMGDELLDLRGRTPVRTPAWRLADALVEQLADASGDDLPRLRDGLAAIRQRGTGADRQLAAWREGGPDALLRAVTVS